MKVLALVGATVVAALLTVVPLALLDGPDHAAAGGVAAALCLIPAVGTLLLAGAVGRDGPDRGTTVILAGIGLRFGGVVAGTFLLGDAVAAAGIDRGRFAGWVVFFYLMTLTAESALLVWPAGPARPDDPGGAAVTTPTRTPGDYRGLALAGMAVGEMVAPILLGVWLDDRYGWAPWGLAVGAVVGVVGGIGHLFIVARRMSRNEAAK